MTVTPVSTLSYKFSLNILNDQIMNENNFSLGDLAWSLNCVAGVLENVRIFYFNLLIIISFYNLNDINRKYL